MYIKKNQDKLNITLTISLHRAVFLTKLMVTQQVKKFPASVELGVPLLYSPEPTPSINSESTESGPHPLSLLL